MVSWPDPVASADPVIEPVDVRDPDLVQALSDSIAILGADLRPRFLIGTIGLRVGFTRADDLSARLADWIHPDDQGGLGDALATCLREPGIDVEARARVHNDVDGWHTMRFAFRNLLAHPDVQGILVRAIDHTVFDREARLRMLVTDSPIGICEIDRDQKCVYVNPAFERLTGIAGADALLDGWWNAIHADDHALVRSHERIADLGETDSVIVRLVAPDGRLRWASARWAALHDVLGEPAGYLGTFEDVTERQMLEQRLEYDATHDRLTGLGSRALLTEELGAALARARRNKHAVALLFIDLDGFKRVNDMLGHGAGDELLVQVARRLRDSVREGDVCVRMGGDEFVVCCPDLESVAQPVSLADRLLARISQPYDVHGHEVTVGASIGMATAQGDDPMSVDQLLSNADLAAYRAKRLGRGRVEMFDDDLRRRLAQSRRIARRVANLLDEPRVPLLCTPIGLMGPGGLVGFDCTVDWDRAGLDDHAAVAHVVDETGMSRALDLALVRTLVAQLAEWERDPPGPIVPGLSVRLTIPSSFSPALADAVRDELAHSSIDPSRLWLGIPEAAVAQDLDAASVVAAALDDLGIGVALRDFGSAVSSLEQLRKLPTPTMTIAGSLVASLHTSRDDVHRELLGAIVKYARALGRVVMVSDVQDRAHAAVLHELGCEFGSGPAFGPTVPAENVRAFLQRR